MDPFIMLQPQPWRNDLLYGFPGRPIEERDRLPLCAGLYFVFDDPDKVLYIGKSKNIRNRWRSHHRLPDLIAHRGVWIHWLRVDHQFSEEALGALELWCIDRFRPRYNYAPTANVWRDRFAVVLRALRHAEATNRELVRRLQEVA